MTQYDKAIQKALGRALNLISYRQRTESELRRRLSEKAEPDVVDAAVERLKEQGLIDDAKYATEWSDSRARRSPRSSRMIVRELVNKGVAPSLAESSVEVSGRRRHRIRRRIPIRDPARRRRLRTVPPPAVGPSSEARLRYWRLPPRGIATLAGTPERRGLTPADSRKSCIRATLPELSFPLWLLAVSYRHSQTHGDEMLNVRRPMAVPYKGPLRRRPEPPRATRAEDLTQ